MTGINRQPPGLSDLLRVQAGGKNPDEFSQMIRGTMDMYPFYQVDRLRAAIEPFSLSVGQREFIEVPEGEAWLVEFMTVSVTSSDSSANVFQFAFGIERLIGLGLNGVEIVSTGEFGASSSSTSAVLVAGGQLPRPFMAMSGQRLTLLLGDESSVPAVAGDFAVVYTLLKI